MRKYGKWALTLGLLASTPGLGLAAAPWSRADADKQAEKPSARTAETPKNNNQELADDVAKALAKAKLQGYDIEIECKDGTAVLKGRVVDPKQKDRATDGIDSTTPLNARLVRTSTRMGEVAVTVAVRGTFVRSAISPNQSPAPSSESFRDPFVAFAVPSTITKNSRPARPSRVKTEPDRRSISSAFFASSRNSAFEHPAKSGTRLSRSILAFPPSRTARS